MSRFARLASASFIALATALTVGLPAWAETTPVVTHKVTAEGSFLAGQEALGDLRTAEAARFFGQAAAADPDNGLLADRAFFSLAADGQIDAASDAARRVVELEPTNELAHVFLAVDAIKDGRYDAAVSELENLGSDTFGGITGGILRAWALIGDDRADDAIALMDELGASGLEEFLIFHRALMLEVTGRQDEAIEAAARAYEAEAKAWVVEAYVRMLGNADRFDEAAKVLADYRNLGLTHPLLEVVETAISAKKRPGAFTQSVEDGAAQLFHDVGIALARDGGLEFSMMFLQLAHHLDPEADFMVLSMGQLLEVAQQFEAANAVYERIPETSPMYSLATVGTAENLDAMGEHEQAIRRLEEIVAADPENLDALSILGEILRSEDQFGRAAEVYDMALAATGGDNPSDWRFYYVRGIAHERNDDWAKAEADFLKALELNPDQPQVLNYLGYSWVDQGLHLQQALEMIEKAVNAAPNDGYIIDSLGWAFFRLGRFEESVNVLEQAVQLLPNDPEINDHLGDAYWRAGRKLEARFQWNVASSVDELGNVRERVLPKLAGGLDNAPVTEDSAPVDDPANATNAEVTP